MLSSSSFKRHASEVKLQFLAASTRGRERKDHWSSMDQEEAIMVRGRTRKATGRTIAACWMVNP